MVHKIRQIQFTKPQQEEENMNCVCSTGGAPGADHWFEKFALENGHRVIIPSFEGNSETASSQKEGEQKISLREVIVYTDEQLKEHRPALDRAVKTLGRKLKGTRKELCHLQCNYKQIMNADKVYAVGFMDPEFVGGKEGVNCGVMGGTGYTCEMFLHKYLDKHPKADKVPMYLYCYNERSWFELLNNDGKFKWSAIEKPERPCGHYVGIGTRETYEEVREAIEDLYK